jgi:voltage-gated potassium channel
MSDEMGAPAPDPLRAALHTPQPAPDTWLARLERWTEWPLTLLALAFLPILLAPYLFSLSDETVETLEAIDYLIWGVFAADLIAKVAVAPDRRRYLRTHWFDVVLVALPLLRPLRVVRSARALRALRAGRALVAVARVLAGSQRILARRGLGYTLLAGLIIVVAAAGLATIFERDAQDASIGSFADGLWWSVTTITTVGYGDTYPRTGVGRGIGVVLMILGIALFGVITANLAAFFVEEQEGPQDQLTAQLQELNERIRRIEEAIERLR